MTTPSPKAEFIRHTTTIAAAIADRELITALETLVRELDPLEYFGALRDDPDLLAAIAYARDVIAAYYKEDENGHED